MQLIDFLKYILPEPGNYYTVSIRPTGAVRHFKHSSIAQAEKTLLAISKRGNHSYFATGSYVGSRTAEDCVAKRCLHADIDCKPKGQYPGKKEALIAIREATGRGLLQPSIIVDSGNGYHLYWLLEKALSANEWKPLAEQFKTALEGFGLNTDPTVTADLSRILRAPETLNYKSEVPKKCVIKSPLNGSAPRTYKASDIERLAPWGGVVESSPNGAGKAVQTPVPEVDNSDLFEGVGAGQSGDSDNRLSTAFKEWASSHPAEAVNEIERMLQTLSDGDDSLYFNDATHGGRGGNGEWLRIIGNAYALAPMAVRPQVLTIIKRFAKWVGGLQGGQVRAGEESKRIPARVKGLTHYKGEGLLIDATREGYTHPCLQVPIAPSDMDEGDISNGALFARLYRNQLIFVNETSEWLSFAPSTGWIKVRHAEMVAARATSKKIRKLAGELFAKDPEAPATKRLLAHAKKTASLPSLKAMITLAVSEEGMNAPMASFDADLWRVGLPNGNELDLRQQVVYPPCPESRISKRLGCTYDPSALCPHWSRLIAWITGGDKEYTAYLKRSFGYLLTGEVTEQMFWFIYGHGMNGKSTVAEVLRALMGDYAVILPTEALMLGHSQANGASPDIMLLKGARLALTSETEESSRLAEAHLKQLTGGDTIRARPLYGQPVSWQPTHKILMLGNHKPLVSGTDLGIWRRIHLVPFENAVDKNKVDKDLPKKLLGELPGILNWALEGFRDWQRKGLSPPANIVKSVEAYRSDMDMVGQWMAECTDPAPGDWTPTKSLYGSYQIWAQESGHRFPMTSQSFGRRLSDRNITIKPYGPTRRKHANGIALRTNKPFQLAQ